MIPAGAAKPPACCPDYQSGGAVPSRRTQTPPVITAKARRPGFPVSLRAVDMVRLNAGVYMFPLPTFKNVSQFMLLTGWIVADSLFPAAFPVRLFVESVKFKKEQNMSINRVSAALDGTAITAIMNNLSAIRQSLGFLIALSETERRALPKLGDKSYAFVENSLQLATQNPGFLPRDFSIEEMQKDYDLFKSLNPIRQALSKLAEEVDDTLMAVGSEAYVAALLVYNYASRSDVGTAGLDNVLDELGKRFARKLKTKPASTPAE